MDVMDMTCRVGIDLLKSEPGQNGDECVSVTKGIVNKFEDDFAQRCDSLSELSPELARLSSSAAEQQGMDSAVEFELAESFKALKAAAA